MKRARQAWRRWAPLGLMVLSGFSGLGYQIVWTEQCSLWLGHESAAVLAVLAAFFGGLALGGLWLGGRVEASPRPRRWYVGCELVIGAWSLFLLGVGPRVGTWVAALTGLEPSFARQWAVAFLGVLLLFLPATVAMGASLPAMERLGAELSRKRRSITQLYASNTLGALCGVLGAVAVLIPALGLARTQLICAGLNFACAVLGLTLFDGRAVTPPERTVDRDRLQGVALALAVTGFLGVGYEVVVVRVLSQVSEDTVYTFALLLAVYLAGTAAGAAAYRRWVESRRDRERLGASLLAALGAACLLGTLSLYGAERVRLWALELSGSGAGAAIAAEAAPAVLAFALPTLLMGAVFSQLCRAAGDAGASFGQALGANLLAGAVAPILLGLVALPAVGAKATLVALALGYLALAFRRAWRGRVAWLAAVAAAGVLSFAPSLTFVDVPEGGRVVSYEEGVMAAVSVVADAGGTLRLRIDNRQQEGSSASRYVDARQAWLPLLLAPAPRTALFLGLGTGVTARSAAEDGALEVEAVELLPEVIRAATVFSSADTTERRLHVVAADARRFVRSSDRHYDVIVADNFHPARSGSGALYTVEHFAAVRRRLTPAGLFCQWLPLHQLDLVTLASIVRSFVTVYPRAYGILANNSLETPVVGLLARADERPFDVALVRARASGFAQGGRLGLEDELAVLGSFVAGPGALARFAGNAPLNTDDHPFVTYRAPRVTYAPDSSPGDRLSALLGVLSLDPGELVLPPSEAAFPARLAAYWAARHRFIGAGKSVTPSPRVEEMLAQVREPLLSVLRISPDFRPAYDPLLAMASALTRTNAPGATSLLSELARVQPARTEASRLLALLHARASGERESTNSPH